MTFTISYSGIGPRLMVQDCAPEHAFWREDSKTCDPIAWYAIYVSASRHPNSARNFPHTDP